MFSHGVIWCFPLFYIYLQSVVAVLLLKKLMEKKAVLKARESDLCSNSIRSMSFQRSFPVICLYM